MPRHFRLILALLAALFAVLPRHAMAEVYWSAVAAACTPDSGAIQGKTYASQADGSVNLAAKATGTLVLVCPVPVKNNGQPPNTLGLTYRDSTGKATGAAVQAELVRVNRTTGTRKVIATVSSDGFAATTTAFRSSAQFAHALDAAANYYHVRIVISRTVAASDVRGIGVVLESTCGTGTITGLEQCDDSNIVNGDGCSSSCAIESGFNCIGQPSNCTSASICGDGVPTGLEQCDDGNTVGGDGCTSSCTTENGFSCLGAPSVCIADCGNGTINAGEQCDGVDLGGQICTTQGFSGGTLSCNNACTFDTSSCTADFCGDGIVSGVEQCDDANTASGDGCTNSCVVESGFDCTGQPSICVPQ